MRKYQGSNHPLRKYAISHKTTYEQMAKMLGCTPGYLAVIAHGVRQPSPKFAKAIEKKLGIPKTRLRPDIWQ